MEWKVPNWILISLYIQSEILCAAGVPGQLLDHGAVRLQFPHLMERIVDTGVACKNSSNWNGVILEKSMILSVLI